MRGTATVQLVPDRVTFSVGVSSRGAEVKGAYAENASKVEAVIAALKNKGVDAKEIQTSQLSVNNSYGKDGQVTGYEVTNQVTVTRKPSDDIADILQAAVDAGANQMGGFQFLVADLTKGQKEGLEKAFADARARAEALAIQAGARLGEVIALSDESGPIMPEMRGRMMTMAAGKASIEAGVEEMTFSVSVIFELK